ncbi:hypothetical protein CNY89_14725, partial [Amaricoccus sp. HAR-UPW-R2A-40]
ASETVLADACPEDAMILDAGPASVVRVVEAFGIQDVGETAGGAGDLAMAPVPSAAVAQLDQRQPAGIAARPAAVHFLGDVVAPRPRPAESGAQHVPVALRRHRDPSGHAPPPCLHANLAGAACRRKLEGRGAKS